MKKKIEILFSAGVKYKNVYYLAAIHMNALFSYDESKDKLTFLTSFQKEQKKQNLYLKAFLYKDEAWFIPYQANHIAIVNLEKKTVEYMSLLYHREYRGMSIKYINILNFKENLLCLVPLSIDAAMIIDLKNKKARAYYNIVDGKKEYPYHSAVFYNQKIYFFPWMERKILVLDLKTDERAYLNWNQNTEAFRDIVDDKRTGRLFYSPARENRILVCDFYGRLYKDIKFSDWDDRKYRTCYTSENMSELFFWGHEKDIVIKIDKDDYSVKVYEIKNNSAGIYFFPIQSDGIEALVFEGNCIIKYDIEKDTFINTYISTTLDELMHEIGRTEFSLMDVIDGIYNDVFYENDKLQLQQFISYMQDKKKKEHCRLRTNLGDRIYKSI